MAPTEASTRQKNVSHAAICHLFSGIRTGFETNHRDLNRANETAMQTAEPRVRTREIAASAGTNRPPQMTVLNVPAVRDPFWWPVPRGSIY